MQEDLEMQLINDISSFQNSPLNFVKYSFDWGNGELANKQIEKWQEDLLIDIENGLSIDEAIKIAVSSGHGIGKSAIVSWITLWALCTMEDSRGVITANTETQLKTKTWAELAKWYRLCICKDWFNFTATSIFSVDKEHEKTWRVDMIAWSERNTEAFAGMHNEGKRVFLIFDEASAIIDSIWEVSEGALTDKNTQLIWCVFGNPTRNSGMFYDCFNKYRHRWKTKQIDSRSISFTNKETINKWVEDWGEDSDFVKVRVRGDFPSGGVNQFISSEIVNNSRNRIITEKEVYFAPCIIGVDPAWMGGDETVIYMRKGNYSKCLKVLQKNDEDFMTANLILNFQNEYKADKVFIDFGYGTGIYSAGKQLGQEWILVQFGSKANNPRYANKRIEMWADMKEWMKNGGVIENDSNLYNELISPEYYVIPTGPNAGKEILESKEDMKKRGLFSPNRADALALTFAYPVKKKEFSVSKTKINGIKEYDYWKGEKSNRRKM